MHALQLIRWSRGIAALGLLSAISLSAQAASVTWDPNGNQTDGGGSWDSTTTDWWSGTSDFAWTSGNTAVFGVGSAAANPYTVNVNAAITANAIDFNNQAYTLAGGTLTMNLPTTAGSPNFNVAPGVAATINSSINNSAAAYINGGGTLTLGGSDSFTPQVWVDNLTLQVVSGANINIGGSYLVLGNNSPNSNYVQTGGAVTVPTFYVGNAANNTSSVSISGGTFTATSTVFLAERATNSTLNISGGVVKLGAVQTGNGAVDSATINLSAGSLNLTGAANSLLGAATGDRAIFNISGGTAAMTGGYLMVTNNGATAAAVVNQSGGLFNMGASGALLGWAGGTNSYAAYLLSGGTFNMTGGQFTVGNQGSPEVLYSQSGGAATFTNNFYMGFNTIGGESVADISGGTLVHTAGSFMSVGQYATNGTGYGILTVRGGGYLQEQSGNFNVTGNNAAVTGIVNLLTGGTIEANSIKKVSSASATATINFDGGTLRAYSINGGANWVSGLDNAFVYPGGLTVDTNSQNVTIGTALTAPAGYGVGASGSTLAVASGGSGYIGPPVIKFAAPAGGGVAATGVATVNANGTVSGITITSPGSGYASGESVAVTFNNGSNTSNAATSAAAGFNVNASTLNNSGGLTVVGGGALTLAGSNTYTGSTNVSSGTLYLNGSNATPSISVAGGAALGGIGSTATAGANVANGGILDLSHNAGGALNLAGSVTFAGHATINIDALSNYAASPALIAGALVPSSTAGLIGINANLGSVSVLAGTYDVINYSGAIGGAGLPAFTLSSLNGLNSRQHASLVNGVNQIDIVVNGPTPYWGGSQPDWVSGNAWTLQPGGATTTFATGDNDVFDDTAGTGQYAGTVLFSTSNVAPSAVTFNNTVLAYTLSGNYGITGVAPLIISGSGSVTIANSNGYTGPTTIGNYATLQLGAGGNSGSLSPSSAIIDNGMLVFSRSDNIVQGTHFASAAISGVGGLTQLGPGMVTLTAANTFLGPTTISGGTLQLGTGLAGQDGSINATSGVNNNSTLAYNLAGSQTASYAISGGGGLVKSGSGTLVLNAANSYGGGTTISGGTLVSANLLALAGNTAPVTFNNGNSNAELRFTAGVQNSNNTTTYMPITVMGGGTGAVNLTFNQGAAFVDASLNIGQAVTIRTTGTGTSDGMMGQITGNGAGPGNNSVTFSAPPGITFYYTAGYSGYGILANSFLGNVHFTGSGNIVTQNLGYLSPTYVNGAIPNTASVTVDPGTLWTLQWGSQTIDALNGSGSISLTTNGPSPLTLGGNNGSGTYAGTIYGAAAGGLTLSGTGVEVLSGSNTYTSTTTINSGTLQLGTGQAGQDGSINGTSGVTNFSALVYDLAGNQTVSYLISGNGTLGKQGLGKLTLNAANTYSGPTFISGGVLNAPTLANEGSPSAIGQGSGAPSPADLVIDGGTLQYTGPTAASSNWLFTVGPSGRAALDASGGPGGTMTLGSGGGAIAFANSAAPATLTLAGSGAGVLGASVGDSGVSPNFTSLVKMGTGAWTLAGGNSYSGTTAVSAGVLYINGVNATSGPTIISGGALYIEGSNATTSISVAGGTVLGGTGSVTSAGANVANGGTLDFSHNAGNTFSLGGLTFAGHATINVDALSNYTASPVLSTGALTPSSTTGQITIDANLGAATLLSGTYDLISYKGAIGGAGLPAFTVTVNGIGTRQTATLVNAANQIDLVVKGNTPYWNGNQSDWRAANAWTLQPSNSATTFQTGDTDIFDDTANGSTFGGNVALNIGNVAPASVTFNNNALAYTVSGSYGITGSATLTVNGPGTVTIANSNGYTGATTLAGGALNLANPSAIGSGPLNLNGGVLDNTSGSAMALSHNNPQNWNGDFTFNGSNNLNLGTGAVTLGSSRNVTINANTLTVGGLISDGGQGYGFNLNGGGTLVLTASNTYIGPTTISGGTLQLGSGAIGNDGSINGTALVTNNSTLAYNLAGTQTAGYAIGGFGSLVLGSGNLTLLGNNSYSGGTTINGGTLSIGNSQVNGTFGTGQYNIAAGARLYLNYATAVPASNGWSNNISGSGTLELNSAQAVNGSANWGPNSASATVFGPSFTGTLQVDNGRIDSSPEGLGGVSNIIINNGAQFLAWSGTYSMPVTIAGYGWGESGQVGALRAAGNAVTTWAGPITLSNNAGIEAQAGSSFTLTGPITGNYQVDFESNGAGTASVAPSGTNQNSYLSTEIDPGVIVVAGNQYAFSTGALLMNFGTLELDGFNFSFAHVLGSGAIGNYGSNPATLTVGSDNTNTVYGGSLVDGNGGASLNLTKIGSGKLTLTAINTYSGWTTVSSGILQLGNSAALGTSSLAADGGTLDLAGYSATVSSFSGAAGVVSNSVTGTLATLTFNQLIDTTFSGSIMDGRGQVAFDLQGSGTLTLTGTNTFTGGTTVAGGELILANSEALADGSSLTVGNVSLFGISMPANADHGIAAPVSPSVAAVPEPGTLVLVVASAVIAIGVWRRKALRA